MRDKEKSATEQAFNWYLRFARYTPLVESYEAFASVRRAAEMFHEAYPECPIRAIDLAGTFFKPAAK